MSTRPPRPDDPQDDSHEDGPPERDAQWERAHQSWALVIDLEAGELSRESLRQVLRILRVKRMEREPFLARLPGTVRRGARVDLEASFDALVALGVPCRLVHR